MLKDLFQSMFFIATVITVACLCAGVDFEVWMFAMVALVIFYPIGYRWRL